jgi:hypothetical protein
MFQQFRSIGLLAPAVLLTACSMVAPPYAPDVDNIQSLKNVPNAQARVGAFESQAGMKNPYPVPLRADSMKSPVGASFGAYLADAMTKELTMAGKLAPNSDVEITATLLENDVSTGVATGTATLSARFVVTRGGNVRYDQIKSAHTEWGSAFAAMIAIPKAREEYPLAVQKLLGALYADPAFQSAIQ